MFGMVAIESAIGPSDNGDAPDNWVYPELAAAGRARFVCAGFQHSLPPPENAEREPAVSWWCGPVDSSYR